METVSAGECKGRDDAEGGGATLANGAGKSGSAPSVLVGAALGAVEAEGGEGGEGVAGVAASCASSIGGR